VRSSKLVAIVLALAAVGLCEAAPVEPDVDLSERVSRLEAQRAEDRREEANSRGGLIYSRTCAACHGRNGEGNGPGAAELHPWPRDFASGKYRTRSTHSGEPPLRADLEGVVRRGLPGTSMPAFGGALSEPQVADVVTFILSLGPRRGAGHEPEALRIPEFPSPDATDLSDGRALFLILGCWKCHGLNGSGRGPSAEGLKSDEGQRIRPRDFRYDPFKGGRSPETVARAALSGLIGTPMPSHAEIMVPPREAIDALTVNIPAGARPELEDYRRTAPSAADLAELDDDAWEAMRDENLVSLSYYVLSLDRRGRLVYKLFRQRPETEGRQP
jgi:cytochrome c oxidase cbb3-type subunit 2